MGFRPFLSYLTLSITRSTRIFYTARACPRTRIQTRDYGVVEKSERHWVHHSAPAEVGIRGRIINRSILQEVL
jgi:hypothetical protein